MLVEMVLDFLKNNSLNDNIGLESIAKKAYMSPKYFSKLFKQETGQNLTSFIQEIRFEKACELINTTSLSIVEVMHQVGYKDSKFFYQIFKRKTGMTPADYKKNKATNLKSILSDTDIN